MLRLYRALFGVLLVPALLAACTAMQRRPGNLPGPQTPMGTPGPMGAAPGPDTRGAATDPSAALDTALAANNALDGAPAHTLVLGNTALIALTGPRGTAAGQATTPGGTAAPGTAPAAPPAGVPATTPGSPGTPSPSGAPSAGAAMTPAPGATVAGTLDSAALSQVVAATLPWVREVRVATEPQTATRVAEISAQVRAGRPLSDYLSELARLTARMTRVPVTPAQPGAAPGGATTPPAAPGAPSAPAPGTRTPPPAPSVPGGVGR